MQQHCMLLNLKTENTQCHKSCRLALCAVCVCAACRCERCSAEEQLGPDLERSQRDANATAAAAARYVSTALTGSPDEAAALSATVNRLSAAVQRVEALVDSPTVEPRIAMWAHASIYQVSIMCKRCCVLRM